MSVLSGSREATKVAGYHRNGWLGIAEIRIGKTSLTKTTDDSGRFRHCYNVSHEDYHIGKIKFGLLGKSSFDCNVWFSISNRVFYNHTLQFLPDILKNLNLKLSNVTRIHIALDNYRFNFDTILRRHLRNRENKVKLLGRYITDRKKFEKRIRYWNCGSLDNPFKLRTIYIKNKRQVNYSKNKSKNRNAENEENINNESKTTIEFTAYNKLDEIDNISTHKTFIMDYHKETNPNYKNIYREEIRLESEEWKRYVKKREKQGIPIILTDLLNKEFLYEVFTEYIDRIILIRDNKNQKIDLFPKPFLGSCEGKLPLTLPQGPEVSQFIEYNDIPTFENEKDEIPTIKNENKDFNNKEYLKEKFRQQIINNQNYKNLYENYKKIIRCHQTKNKRIPKRRKKSKLRKTPILYSPKQYKNRNDKLLENRKKELID